MNKILFYCCVLVLGAFLAERADAGRVSTESYLKEHASLKDDIARIEEWNRRMLTDTPAMRGQKMVKIAKYLNRYVLPHAHWEEREVYPAALRNPENRAIGLTAVMRHEHGIVERWVARLDGLSRKSNADALEFVRLTDELLGFLKAHFETEEGLIAPLLNPSSDDERSD